MLRRSTCAPAAVSLLLLVIAAAAPARAQPPASVEAVPTPRETAERGLDLAEPEVSWQHAWRRSELGDYLATGSLSLGILLSHFVVPEASAAHWRGPLLFDAGARQGLRQGSSGGRSLSAEVSDYLLWGLLAWSLSDSAVAWVGWGSPDAAGQLLSMDLQAFALTYLVTQLTKNLVGRERPFADRCESGATADSGCDSNSRYKSFISGHTSMAFTSAALVCAHHENLPLYGGGAMDNLACYVALGAATAVGALRVVADRHYLSDVLMGAGLGIVSGYLLPNWLHFDIGEDDPDTDAPSGGSLSPMAAPDAIGVSYSHVFM